MILKHGRKWDVSTECWAARESADLLLSAWTRGDRWAVVSHGYQLRMAARRLALIAKDLNRQHDANGAAARDEWWAR